MLKKNLLDLEHSEKLTRGVTEIAIAVGGFLSILVTLSTKALVVAIITALIFALIFLIDGLKKISECKEIRKRISNLVVYTY